MESRPVETAGLSAESLRWTLGSYCAFVGAFMLVAPHRYAGLLYEGLRPYEQWWGMAALCSGMALLAVAILRPGRAVNLGVHGLAGCTLLILGLSFAGKGAWTGAVTYCVFGAGLLAAGFLPRPASSLVTSRERDLFALLMGAVAVINGAAFISLPRLSATLYATISRLQQLVLGSALLGGGLLLLAVYLVPALRSPRRGQIWAAHLAAGVAFILLGVLVSLPRRSWTGIAFYLGCGIALALLPWLSHLLARLDTQALRTRLALALATATSIALILTAAVATSQEERLSTLQVLETREIEAQSIARTVADSVELNAAQTATVAALAGRELPEPGLQRLFLERTHPLYPHMTGLVSLDPGGRVLAAVGEVSLETMDWRDTVRDVARTRGVSVQLLAQPGRPPHLVLSAPVIGLDGSFAGALVSVLGARALEERIARLGSNVQLADGLGQIIAHRDGTEPVGSSGPLPAGWDRRIAAGEPVSTRDGLAGFARVPRLGWVVAVERPRSAALAGVRQGRDMAFALLLAVVPLAILAGSSRRGASPGLWGRWPTPSSR